MIEERTWKEFRGSGLLWFINQILHLFGWAIVLEFDNGELIKAYPARIKFRGFSEESQTKGYRDITKWIKEHVEELEDEAFEKYKENNEEGGNNDD